MRAYEWDGSPNIAGVRPVERSVQVVGPRDVLVKVQAASLNFRDLMIIHGTYGSKVPAGRIPMSDCAGEIVEVGAEVTRFKPGARIVNTFFPRWLSGRPTIDVVREQPSTTTDGILAEYICLAETSAVALPDGISFEEGATLPCAAVTAWSSLYGPRPLQAGETVLTQGTGGVSIFALQFAKAAGARVIATTSSERKEQLLRELGADEVVNYRTTPDWSAAVQSLTNRRGADHIMEIGGAGTLERSIRACGIDGYINMIGLLETAGPIDPSIFMRGITNIRRISVGCRSDLEALLRAMVVGGIRPLIDRVFSFDDVPAAYAYFQSRDHVGKVVVAFG